MRPSRKFVKFYVKARLTSPHIPCPLLQLYHLTIQYVVVLRSPCVKVGILEHWNLSMDLFNARIKSPVRNWQVGEVNCGVPYWTAFRV